MSDQKWKIVPTNATAEMVSEVPSWAGDLDEFYDFMISAAPRYEPTEELIKAVATALCKQARLDDALDPDEREYRPQARAAIAAVIKILGG